MKTLEVRVSDEVYGVLNTLAKQSDKFVADAIREKIERRKRDLLLVEGYKATFQEDLAIAKEFETVDFENL